VDRVDGNNLQVVNNTIYEPTGNAVQIDHSGANTSFTSNIVWAQAGYDLLVVDGSGYGLQSDYNDLYTTGSAKLAQWGGTDILTLSALAYELGMDVHSISADPLFVNPAGAVDGILGDPSGTDYGADDDFHVLATSPTIDAGDPNGSYINEPQPNGGRVNIGSDGNSASANTSPSQLVQVISPGGLQRVQSGNQYAIDWHTSGLTTSAPIALIHTGAGSAVPWLADTYNTSTGVVFNETLLQTIDQSSLTSPIPQAVFQSYEEASSNLLSYQIPVPDGTYTIHLYWASLETATNRDVMKILAQGSVVNSGFDIFAAAGGQYKAATFSFSVTASGGTGISLALSNVAGDMDLGGNLCIPECDRDRRPQPRRCLNTDGQRTTLYRQRHNLVHHRNQPAVGRVRQRQLSLDRRAADQRKHRPDPRHRQYGFQSVRYVDAVLHRPGRRKLLRQRLINRRRLDHHRRRQRPQRW
jgi:hypothetical protein